MYDKACEIAHNGALVAFSGEKTGRSPKDKRVVDEESTSHDVWWGPVNVKMSPKGFSINRERALSYLNTRDRLYVVDGLAGWDVDEEVKIRVVCERPYHALFMRTMLIKPGPEKLKSYNPDFVIYNAGKFPCNPLSDGMTSNTSIAINLKEKEMVILGTEYAGEMKKGVFSVMMYEMMKRNMLPLHSSCNQAADGSTSLFFGLSGTGKTTLSADPERFLIGDDEHVWHDKGVFNIEGGCYAKCINLSEEKEPEIFHAIKYGAILENVGLDNQQAVDYTDVSLTQNTRCAYPLEHIDNAKLPAIGGHPTNVILLTCDAFGVLPPVSKLTSSQAMYHFISGYTAKVAGTEQGVTEPTVTFSSCYGSPFLVMHPVRYAKKLAEMLSKHQAPAWLINTGWVGGKFGEGSRISLKHTRAIIDAIHNGSLVNANYSSMPVFGLEVPDACAGVPSELLNPRNSWKDKSAFDTTANLLASQFVENFEQYQDEMTPDVLAGGPSVQK